LRARGDLSARSGAGRAGGHARGGGRGGAVVKWVFLLCLLVVGAAGGVLAATVAYRWMTSMQADVKFVPGDLPLAPPPGTVPRSGGELVIDRALYETRRSPIAPTADSVGRGQKLFGIYCTPCHGIGGKGDGPVTPRFIPPPDLTSAPVQAKSDG